MLCFVDRRPTPPRLRVVELTGGSLREARLSKPITEFPWCRIHYRPGVARTGLAARTPARIALTQGIFLAALRMAFSPRPYGGPFRLSFRSRDDGCLGPTALVVSGIVHRAESPGRTSSSHWSSAPF